MEQEPEVYRDVKIFFNANASKFVVTSKQVLDPASEVANAMKTWATKSALKHSSVGSVSSKRSSAGGVNDASQMGNQASPLYEECEIELQFLLLQQREGFRYF